MLNLEELLRSRRDTRHFKTDAVPDEVIEKALAAGHMAPSVGLTDATRYYIIRDESVKHAIRDIFDEYNNKALNLIELSKQKTLYNTLKLEGIVDAPVGLLVCYDRSVLNNFTIGTIASNDTIKFSAVCAVQNIWLSLTDQGYSMGWVSILNYHRFKKLLDLPEEIEPLGYFCVGKPATDYEQQPMLQQLGWKNKAPKPHVTEISSIKQQTSFTSGVNDPGFETLDLSAILQKQIDEKTKPVGSLGLLEKLAKQIGMVFETTKPQITNPHIVVFAADHGIAQHGVSNYPAEVTRQMVNNFLEGGAAISVFCKQHNIALKIVDAGVNYDFPSNQNIINNKIAKGTSSFLNGPAMSSYELHLCFEKGAEVVNSIYQEGCNTIGFGEMGIGNTSSASVLMSVLCNIPLIDCIGIGTGVENEKLNHKISVLQQAVANFTGQSDIRSYMAYFGGFEIMQIAGAILEARNKKMLILIDGFIVTVAFLCAFLINPSVKENAVFCHESGEKGHRLLLERLNAEALLHLRMRLGEGSGCAVAFPLINSAVGFLNDMASFESADVSNKA
ncbi:nicotinate-nucleotide--dimethylbenzimidazole phosphoribosyltransferase [Mucilaginibacter aquaedulcis]|uniref:nicotinate-nucleotide--dimethylbenzimidazole phosphoribosyltransferase n=1 Tax=Mucilaginibacter aquaedulcis TaxID=1187081 RepID=UPI0025B34225|nr:nicotinate-nucleotide--dimethylbenzimidazole phosphoribosyltransferase [Mucilaginibacter aquaedulcis]MDN3548205.1 nicotinate-nucleotide--dimethylbenzimidazole phosphoribosyltransferase [Mucilaginibacter aquaedulcis]